MTHPAGPVIAPCAVAGPSVSVSDMDTNAANPAIALADASRFDARFVYNSDRYVVWDTLDDRAVGLSSDYFDDDDRAKIDRLNRKYRDHTAGDVPADVIVFRVCKDTTPSSYDTDRAAHVGPYMAGTGADIGGDCFANNRPGPDADGIHRMRAGEVCGFSSGAALVAWFPAERHAALAGDGYTVRAFRVPFADVRFGRRQLVFRASTGVEVGRWDVSAFGAIVAG